MIQGGIMKKLIFLFILSLLLVGMAWGQTTVISENFAKFTPAGGSSDIGGSLNTYTQTPGWTGSKIYTDGGRAKLGSSSGKGIITTPTIDLSANSGNATLSFLLSCWSADTGKYIQVLHAANGTTFTQVGADISVPATATTTTLNITGGTANSKIRIQAKNASNNRFYLDDLLVTQVSASTPTITVSPASLSGFTYVFGSGPSTPPKDFNISGANLTADIGMTAPTHYEISKSSSSGYADSLTFAKSGNTVAEQTVYVRLKTGLAIGDYNSETITATSSGATNQTVTCSGSVTTPPAPSAPTATAATSVTANSFTANWNAVSGATGYKLDVYTKTVGTNATDLFISEYIEGSSNNKYIEIFNGTGSAVDLSDYYLRLFPNGQTENGESYINNQLSGNLANGACIVYMNGSAALTLPAGVTAVTNTAVNFNGDDAVALYKVSTTSYVDIFGRIGDDPGSAWTGDGGYTTVDKTLVRKSSVTGGITTNPSGTGPTAFTTLTTEWDMYPADTTTYLGSHTMTGGTTKTFVSGYNDKDVNNVTSYPVSGLAPTTEYFYVVRAYNSYGTSVSSNEISVTTTAAPTYDYPEDVETSAGVGEGEVLITITGGNGNIVNQTLTPVPNPNFTVLFEQAIELIQEPFVDDTWIVTVFSQNEWVACLFDGNWMVAEVPGSGEVEFWIELPAGKGSTIIELKSGNGGSPTLPVELSSFTVALNSTNQAVLTWVTQTETGVNGFYIYRNTEGDLADALLVSNLIPATNSSQQQVYIYRDKELNGAGTYYYWLQVSDLNGSESYHGPITLVYEGENDHHIPVIPEFTELKKIFPNPFNPSATISYGLVEAAPVSIKIYNSRGQMVRSFEEGLQNAGSYNLTWNGEDNSGRSLPTGVYYIRMQAGNKSFDKKAVLMK